MYVSIVSYLLKNWNYIYQQSGRGIFAAGQKMQMKNRAMFENRY